MILLDANIAIALTNVDHRAGERFRSALAAGETIALSVIALFELRYGADKSSRPEHNHARIDALLAGPIGVETFTVDDAAVAGRVRADLERQGTPIGPYDLLIAGQALRLDATIATNNVGEFSRVEGLMIDDWLRSRAGRG